MIGESCVVIFYNTYYIYGLPEEMPAEKPIVLIKQKQAFVKKGPVAFTLIL